MATNESLATLHTALIDAHKGYETAFENAEAPKVKTIFHDMMSLHENAHTEVHKLLLSLGEAVDENGSFMATVHKAVISARSALVGLDQNSLSSFVDGEQRIVSDYDDAIADMSEHTEATSVLNRQRSLLTAKVAEMKRLMV